MLAKIRKYFAIPTLFVFLAIQPAFLGGCELKLCKKEEDQTIKKDEIFFGSAAEPINLVMWYVFEQPDVMNTLASQYKAKHRYVTITPIKYDSFNEYTEQLGLKSGTDEAPDVYFIRHDWLPLYYRKLEPMPDKILNYSQDDPDKKETLDEYLDLFFPALEEEFVRAPDGTEEAANKDQTGKQLYGLPWGVEGLALFVNIDHFNEYNRANPTNRVNVPIPNETMTWTQFAEAAQKLIKTTSGWAQVSSNPASPTQIDYDKVERFGAAFGNAYNVQHSTDIFTTMLMQNSVDVVSADHQTVEFIKGTNITAAVDALDSYTSFGSIWDKNWPSSIDAFAQNKVALAFGRSFQVQSVEGISSLHFEVVPFPQRSNNPDSWVTPSYYWARVVNNSSQNSAVAWDFIRFVAQAENMKSYSEITKVPPARLDLIDQVDLGSTKFNIFAQALPYTRSWYKGDADAADGAIMNAINNVADKKRDAQASLTQAAKDIEQILENYQL